MKVVIGWSHFFDIIYPCILLDVFFRLQVKLWLKCLLLMPSDFWEYVYKVWHFACVLKRQDFGVISYVKASLCRLSKGHCPLELIIFC